jgi:hypothetical protein
MTDAEVNAVLDQHPRIEDEYTREIARGVMRRLEARGRHDDAYWARVERAAVALLAQVHVDAAVDEAIALIDAIDRRRRGET